MIEGAPRVPVLGVYPTLESLALQGLLVLLAVVALVWAMRPVSRQPSGVSGQPEERPSG